MNAAAIFLPAIAQVTLTGVVMTRMFFVRIGEMKRRKLDPQSVSTSRAAAGQLLDIAPADNFRNLFEVPVLLFAICPVLYLMNAVTYVQLALAWGFVAGRCLHSLIHVTYNRVIHRFAIYILSTLCVFAMWAIFAIRLWPAT
jgi:hypothetical protein